MDYDPGETLAEAIYRFRSQSLFYWTMGYDALIFHLFTQEDTRLNPCFIGQWATTSRTNSGTAQQGRLNPCFIGQWATTLLQGNMFIF